MVINHDWKSGKSKWKKLKAVLSSDKKKAGKVHNDKFILKK